MTVSDWLDVRDKPSVSIGPRARGFMVVDFEGVGVVDGLELLCRACLDELYSGARVDCLVVVLSQSLWLSELVVLSMKPLLDKLFETLFISDFIISTFFLRYVYISSELPS
jgi:hypothetical protein